MKLLIIYHAGLTEDAKNIFREYVRQGTNLTVIAPSEFYSSTGHCLRYSHSDDELTYRFIPVEFKVGFKFLPLFYAIKQVKPDVIHVLDDYSSIYLAEAILCRNILYGHPSRKATAWRRKKVPVFTYVLQNIPFNSPPFIFEFSLRFLKRIIYRICYPLILRYNNKNVNGALGSNSEALLNVKNLNSNIPVKLIFWGVDLKNFYHGDPVACRKKIGVPLDVKLIGYVGRFVKEKGIDTLIKAVNKIQNCRLMLVGGGDYQEELKKLVSSLSMENRVYFLNNVSRQDLKTYYNSFDVFILPSKTTLQWKEQYGRVLVEAMACGLPVIGSSSGAIGEVLKGYPKALIFREGDFDNLVKKLKEVEKLEFPENFNLGDFLYKFGVEHFVAKHLAFYKKFLP